MLFGKINEHGEVVEYPIFSIEVDGQTIDILSYFVENQAYPQNIVEIDTSTRRPIYDWRLLAVPTLIEKVDDAYIMNYTEENRFATDEEAEEYLVDYLQRNNLARSNSRWFDNKSKALLSGYSEFEVQTWDQQLEEAKRYIDNPAANSENVRMLQNISNGRNISLAELSNKVIEKAEAHSQKMGELIGKRKAGDEKLEILKADPSIKENWHYLNDLMNTWGE